MRRFSFSEDDQNATDTEQHDSLPEDPSIGKQPLKPRPSWGGLDFQNIANKALQMKKIKSDNNDVSSDTKHVQIKDTQNSVPKVEEVNLPLSSRRQDSDCSVWSENIPVITISKTESSENILRGDEINTSKEKGFQPRIRCILRKQSTEIDEDTIRHFSNNIEKNISEREVVKIIEGDEGNPILRCKISSSDVTDDNETLSENSKTEEVLSDRSSSDETEQKNGSVETILNFNINDDE